MMSQAFSISDILVFYLYDILTSELRHEILSFVGFGLKAQKYPHLPNLSKIKPI